MRANPLSPPVGVCLFALLCGRLPFGGPELQTSIPSAAMKQRILAGQYTVDFSVEPRARDLVTRMLCPSPADRISVADVVAHPWINTRWPESPLVSPVRPGLPAAPSFAAVAVAPPSSRTGSTKSTASEGIVDIIDDVLSAGTQGTQGTQGTPYSASGVTTKSSASNDLPSRSSLVCPAGNGGTSDDSSIGSTAAHAGGGIGGGVGGDHTAALVDELDKSMRGPLFSRASSSASPSPRTVGLEKVDTVDALSGSFHGTALTDEVFDRSEHGTVRLVGRLKPPTWARIDEDAEFVEGGGGAGAGAGTGAGAGAGAGAMGLGGIAAAAAKPVPRRRLTAPEVVRSKPVTNATTPDKFAALAAAGGGGGYNVDSMPAIRRHSTDLSRSLHANKGGLRPDAFSALNVSQHSSVGDDGKRRSSAGSDTQRPAPQGTNLDTSPRFSRHQRYPTL